MPEMVNNSVGAGQLAGEGNEPKETRSWTPQGAESQTNWAKLSKLSLKWRGRRRNEGFLRYKVSSWWGELLVGRARSMSEQERRRGRALKQTRISLFSSFLSPTHSLLLELSSGGG